MSERYGAMPLAALLAVVAAGCARDVSQPASPQAGSVTASAPAAHAAGPTGRQPEVTLRIGDEAELARLIKTYRGKVVLVDFWATWCLPCVELFPHTVSLARRLGDEGLAVISVSFDEPESEPAVRRLLTGKGAAFDNLLSPYGITPKAWEAYGIEDGALPHVRLYDRQGKVHKTFGAGTGSFTGEDIERAVEELLGKSE